MVGSQRQEDPVDHDNVLEVVDDTLAVEKVHGYRQPVPVQALGGLDVPGATSSARDGNDFLERDDLDGGDDDDNVDVAHEEGGEEAANHDQGPYCALDEVGLFLFVVGELLLLLVVAGTVGFLWEEGEGQRC